jgi:hypothetical protein
MILVKILGNGSSCEPEHQGDLTTILSIDGGGVRGIIPSEVLSVLESKLQVNLFSQHACSYFPSLNFYTLELYIYSSSFHFSCIYRNLMATRTQELQIILTSLLGQAQEAL